MSWTRTEIEARLVEAVDGCLSQKEQALFLAGLARHEDLHETYQELLALRASLLKLGTEKAPEGLGLEICAALQGEPQGASKFPPPAAGLRALFKDLGWLRVAALFLLPVILGTIIIRDHPFSSAPSKVLPERVASEAKQLRSDGKSSEAARSSPRETQDLRKKGEVRRIPPPSSAGSLARLNKESSQKSVARKANRPKKRVAEVAHIALEKAKHLSGNKPSGAHNQVMLFNMGSVSPWRYMQDYLEVSSLEAAHGQELAGKRPRRPAALKDKDAFKSKSSSHPPEAWSATHSSRDLALGLVALVGREAALKDARLLYSRGLEALVANLDDGGGAAFLSAPSRGGRGGGAETRRKLRKRAAKKGQKAPPKPATREPMAVAHDLSQGIAGGGYRSLAQEAMVYLLSGKGATSQTDLMLGRMAGIKITSLLPAKASKGAPAFRLLSLFGAGPLLLGVIGQLESLPGGRLRALGSLPPLGPSSGGRKGFLRVPQRDNQSARITLIILDR